MIVTWQYNYTQTLLCSIYTGLHQPLSLCMYAVYNHMHRVTHNCVLNLIIFVGHFQSIEELVLIESTVGTLLQ